MFCRWTVLLICCFWVAACGDRRDRFASRAPPAPEATAQQRAPRAKPAAPPEAKEAPKAAETDDDDKEEGTITPEEIKAEALREVAGANLAKAKAMIDKMAGDVEKMIAEVEAAGADQAKVKEITEKFKKSTEGMKTEGEALSKSLSDDEKKQLDAYGKEKMAPIMGKFMGVMMKAQMAGQPPAK